MRCRGYLIEPAAHLALLDALLGRGTTAHEEHRLVARLEDVAQWCVRRSSSAVVIFVSPNIVDHSPKSRLVSCLADGEKRQDPHSPAAEHQSVGFQPRPKRGRHGGSSLDRRQHEWWFSGVGRAIAIARRLTQLMRPSAWLLPTAALIGGTVSVSAADIEIRAVRDRNQVGITRPESVAANLVVLVESCSVNSTAYAVSNDTWAQVLDSDSFVHVIFPSPRQLRIKGGYRRVWENYIVREILLPLPVGRDPPHVYVKTGKETLSATKYDPYALRELALEKELRLWNVPPYDLLLSLPSKR